MKLDYIKQGDCLELIRDIPDNSVNIVLTDPPYGINYQSQRKKDKMQWKKKIKNDKKPFIDFIPQLKRILSDDGCVFIFTRWDVQQQFIDELKNADFSVKNVLIWDKGVHGMGDLKHSFGSRYESIIFCANKNFRFTNKRPVDILKFNRVPPAKLIHPNEKPIKLLEYIISNCCREDGLLLDCFMGSGSTCVAAINTNRHYIGFELDKEYFEIAEERISNVCR